MDLANLPRAALHRRRQSLLTALGDQPALLVAGHPRPRNYAANTFAFRPHSHFLYFFGWGIPAAAALFADGRVSIYAPEPDSDEALWSGPQLTLSELQALLGVDVAPLGALPAAIQARGAATLPAPDAASREQQAALLARPIVPGGLTDADARLADAIIALRLQHDDAAIVELREAAAVTALAHRAGMLATRPGVRESVVRAAMEAELIAHGCATAYGSIVTVHGEILHNETHTNLLAEGDLLLADVGAESPGGWAGDVTRTWPVSATYSAEQADIYNVVLGAQRAAIEAVRPGVRYRELHLTATEVIARGLVDLGLLRGDPKERAQDGCAALFFPHGVGHLLGLDVHDMEDLGDRAGYASGRTRSTAAGLRYLRLDRDLAAGMAVTIEPGIYFVPAMLDNTKTRQTLSDRVNWNRVDQVRALRGIRIEDDVLVTSTGAEVLTVAIPKRIDEIETIAGERPR